MRVRVFYHDKCFDGASSAALFSRFYRERIRSDVEFTFSGLLHRAGALFNVAQTSLNFVIGMLAKPQHDLRHHIQVEAYHNETSLIGLALAIARKLPEAEITGADFCAEMLAVARSKGLANTLVADALQLPFSPL